MTSCALGVRFALVLALIAGFAEVVQAETEAEAETDSNVSTASQQSPTPFSAYYFGIMYGPSLGDPSSFQPTPLGQRDLTKPVILKNFLGLSYNFSDDIAATATAYWVWQPVLGQQFMMSDPFLRISDAELFHDGPWNLYGDLRFHFPVTTSSRDNDLLSGIQTFEVLTYEIGTTNLTVGAYGSLRVNFYGQQGYGNDVELYFAPSLNYQVSSNLALTLLYEINADHLYGDTTSGIGFDGNDLEPGVAWNVTPNLWINPYLNLYPGSLFNLRSTSLGMMLSWQLL